MSDDIVTLIEEHGAERSFRVHDAIDLDETTYYVVEALDDPDQVLVLRERDGGLDAIEGEELDRVLDALDRPDGSDE